MILLIQSSNTSQSEQIRNFHQELLHLKDEEIAALLETTVEDKGKQSDKDNELENLVGKLSHLEIARQTGG